jgi:hypothetical protein
VKLLITSLLASHRSAGRRREWRRPPVKEKHVHVVLGCHRLSRLAINARCSGARLIAYPSRRATLRWSGFPLVAQR